MPPKSTPKGDNPKPVTKAPGKPLSPVEAVSVAVIFERNSYNPIEELIKLSKSEELDIHQRIHLHWQLSLYHYQKKPEVEASSVSGGDGRVVATLVLGK